MILLKANRDTESGVIPSNDLVSALDKYNETLINAGVLETAEGLQPTSNGVRVRISGTQRVVMSGPFPDAYHDIAGFWIFNVESMEAAIEWVKRCPFPVDAAGDVEIEIRQVYEADDAGTATSPEQHQHSHIHEHGVPMGVKH